jgi:hypothetical protein
MRAVPLQHRAQRELLSLRVIRCLSRNMKKKKEHWNENFYCEDLRGKDFSGHVFIRCIFKASIMDETTNLRGAHFEGCNLSMIDGAGSNWEKSVRNYCDLTYSDFSKTNQRFSRLYWSDAKGVKWEGGDLTGIETDFSRMNFGKFDGARLTGWSREIIAEILRQGSDSVRIKQVAAWIEKENQLCWEQFLLLKDHPDIQPIAGQVIDILSRNGFAELIENGGRLCQSRPSSPGSEQPPALVLQSLQR